MYIGNISVQDILVQHFGEDKAAAVLSKIDDSYQGGKRGADLEADLKIILSNEGLDPGDIRTTYVQVVP